MPTGSQRERLGSASSRTRAVAASAASCSPRLSQDEQLRSCTCGRNLTTTNAVTMTAAPIRNPGPSSGRSWSAMLWPGWVELLDEPGVVQRVRPGSASPPGWSGSGREPVPWVMGTGRLGRWQLPLSGHLGSVGLRQHVRQRLRHPEEGDRGTSTVTVNRWR